MSDKFSNETNVCNLLHDYLVLNDYKIIQLITPGGQAQLSITYNSLTTQRKTIFPDLIAIKNNSIIIGEVKASYSEDDRLKLLDLKNAENGITKIKRLVARLIKQNTDEFQVDFILIHGDLTCDKNELIKQLIISKEVSKII